MLLKKNPLFVYEPIFESVDLFYKICQGAQRGPCQNIDFIYPGKNENKYKINTINVINYKTWHIIIIQVQNGVDPVILRKTIQTLEFIEKKIFAVENMIIVPEL